MFAGAVSWSVLGGRDPMVKLKLRLEQPVRAGVELLLLADNYIALWLAVTREHVFAIALADRIRGPGRRARRGVVRGTGPVGGHPGRAECGDRRTDPDQGLDRSGACGPGDFGS